MDSGVSALQKYTPEIHSVMVTGALSEKFPNLASDIGAYVQGGACALAIDDDGGLRGGAWRGLPQPTLSNSHGSKGFSICGLPGLTQRGTRHFPLNAHVAGRVLVLRPNRQVDHQLVLGERRATRTRLRTGLVPKRVVVSNSEG